VHAYDNLGNFCYPVEDTAKSIGFSVQRYTILPDGSLNGDHGVSVALARIDDRQIHVPHLAPHIISFHLPKGDIIGIKVIYSSHCWSESYDPNRHLNAAMFIMDGSRPRVFDTVRFEESRVLNIFLNELATHQLYLTPSDRNFGVYNATTIVNGVAYTAFFTLKKERNRLDGFRHSLVMRVESAYHAPQPSRGMKIKAAAAINAALLGKKLTFR
jgi:hypothetical protein